MFCVLLNFGFISCVVVFFFGGESSDFILSLFSSSAFVFNFYTKKVRPNHFCGSVVLFYSSLSRLTQRE